MLEARVSGTRPNAGLRAFPAGSRPGLVGQLPTSGVRPLGALGKDTNRPCPHRAAHSLCPQRRAPRDQALGFVCHAAPPHHKPGGVPDGRAGRGETKARTVERGGGPGAPPLPAPPTAPRERPGAEDGRGGSGGGDPSTNRGRGRLSLLEARRAAWAAPDGNSPRGSRAAGRRGAEAAPGPSCRERAGSGAEPPTRPGGQAGTDPRGVCAHTGPTSPGALGSAVLGPAPGESPVRRRPAGATGRRCGPSPPEAGRGLGLRGAPSLDMRGQRQPGEPTLLWGVTRCRGALQPPGLQAWLRTLSHSAGAAALRPRTRPPNASPDGRETCAPAPFRPGSPIAAPAGGDVRARKQRAARGRRGAAAAGGSEAWRPWQRGKGPNSTKRKEKERNGLGFCRFCDRNFTSRWETEDPVGAGGRQKPTRRFPAADPTWIFSQLRPTVAETAERT
ncbi:uncharacterized protein [Manis javanica]|uniref:uncharacterized protein n=1 Tax=Manis javanica TaxID=9974 RepID=UPI003C6D560C